MAPCFWYLSLAPRWWWSNRSNISGRIKNYAQSEIEWNGEVFIHTSKGTFFEENGVRAAYTRAQNLE